MVLCGDGSRVRWRLRTRRSIVVIFGAIASPGLTMSVLGAQSIPAAQTSSALATITTDTGAFAPGHRDFSRYTTPALCLAATSATLERARRSLEIQTIRDTLTDARQDTIGYTATAAVARTCWAQLGVRAKLANIPARDLPALFATAILMRDDTMAQRVLARQVALAPTDAEKFELRRAALRDLLGMTDRLDMNGRRPVSAPLLGAVQGLIADIDRDSSIAHRLQTREVLLRFWEMNDSLEAIHQVANEIITLLRHAPDGALKPNDVRMWYGAAYADLMTVAFFTHPDSMLPLAKRAQQDTPEIWLAFKGASDLRALSAHEVVSLLAPIGTAWDPQQRRRTPPLGKAVWYPKGADTVRAIPGQMTMFVVGGGMSVASRIRHWLAQPGARGLHVTIIEGIDDTAAYWAPEEFGLLQGPLTQAEREERARWYYLDYERLPVTVAVQARHVELQPSLNALRTVVTPAPFELITGKEKGIHFSGRALCPGAEPGCVILTDRDGRIVWNGNVFRNLGWYESRIDRIVAWAAAQPVTSTPTPVSAPPLN